MAKFVRHCGNEQHTLAVLHVAYINMLHAMCASTVGCENVLLLLDAYQGTVTRAHAMLPDRAGGALSVSHFYAALAQYAQVYGKSTGEYTTSSTSVSMSKDEMEGMVVWLQLLGKVAASSSEYAMGMLPHCLPSFTLLLQHGCPLAIKTAIVDVLAALATHPTAVARVWNVLAESGTLNMRNNGEGGVERELAHVECRLETYDFSLAVVQLFIVLLREGRPRDKVGVVSVISISQTVDTWA